MTRTVRCPHCEAKYEANHDPKSRDRQCPKCGCEWRVG